MTTEAPIPTAATRALIDAVRGTRTVELGHPHFTGMPCSPNHPGFRMTLIRRHGDMVRADGGSAANEIIVTGGHVGTHVDALSHVSHDGLLHGGVDAAGAQQGGTFSTLGAEHTPFLLTRGVLLDVAATKDVDTLPAGYGVTTADLEASALDSFLLGYGDVDPVELLRAGGAALRAPASLEFAIDPADFVEEPAPAPTLRMLPAGPSAASISAAMAGSGCR